MYVRATDQGGRTDTQENQDYAKQTEDEVLATSIEEDDIDAVELRCGISIDDKNSS